MTGRAPPAILAENSRRRRRTNGADSGALDEIPAKSSNYDALTVDPDLTAVIAAWPTLPPPIRSGVFAHVRAAGGRHE